MNDYYNLKESTREKPEQHFVHIDRARMSDWVNVEGSPCSDQSDKGKGNFSAKDTQRLALQEENIRLRQQVVLLFPLYLLEILMTAFISCQHFLTVLKL